jgi:23S rRNA pseudouridine1911/1915/1917 synthase
VTEEHHRERIPAALVGQRVDRVIALVTGLSRSRAVALVTEGRVSLDGVEVDKPSQRLALDQELTFSFEREQSEPVADPEVPFTVVHHDDAVVVIDKPAGVVVHPGAGVRDGTLVSGLLSRFPELVGIGAPQRPGIVHRLDRGTSGLLVVARTPAAYEHLVGQLRTRRVERRYLALVRGRMESSRGLIDAPLGRSPGRPARRAVVAGGREARTHYRVLADRDVDGGPPVTLVECRLETGRTHQIRAHLAAIGHPVVGDADYGGTLVVPPSCASLGRPFLHARQLGFEHPVSGEHLTFVSPLPPDLVTIVEELGIDSSWLDGDPPHHSRLE